MVRRLPSMPDDSLKVNLYGDIIEMGGKDTLVDLLKWFDEGQQLVAKIGNTVGEAALWNSLGNSYRRRSDTRRALECYNKSLEINTRINNKFSMAINHNNLGNLYNNEGRYLLAITHLMQSLKLFEELDKKTRAGSVMMSIGNVYADQKMPEKALPFYKASLKVKQETKDSVGIVSNYINIGALYYDSKEYSRALGYFKNALEVSKKIGFERGVFVCLNNTAEILYRQGNYKDALQYQLQSYELRKQNGDRIDITFSLSELGNTYLKLGDTRKALDHFNEALPMAIESNSFENLASVYDGLAHTYELMGQHEKANQYIRLFIQFKDSLYNESTSNQVAELETRYQTEKKDLEISRKDLELQNASLLISKKNTQVIVLALSVIAILGFGYLFYNRYRLKQKALLDAELIVQQELRNKAIIEAEEKERIRIAKDLHDGIGQQLSAVKMQLSALESDLTLTSQNDQDRMQTMISMVDEAVKEVRTVSHNMMPNALLKSGLVAAFREFVNKLASVGTMKIDLHITGLNERLENTTETVLYRVLQECVSNTVKHAQATEIGIQLLKHDKYLNLIIEDNGRGFDTSKINDFNGIGLKNMLSRIQFLNGTIHFDSYPGKGTTVSIDIPLA